LQYRHPQFGNQPSHARALANFESIETLLERDDMGHCGRLIESRCRRLRRRTGGLEAAGLICLDHYFSLFAGKLVPIALNKSIL
jgi:hypothetical protein